MMFYFLFFLRNLKNKEQKAICTLGTTENRKEVEVWNAVEGRDENQIAPIQPSRVASFEKCGRFPLGSGRGFLFMWVKVWTIKMMLPQCELPEGRPLSLLKPCV